MTVEPAQLDDLAVQLETVFGKPGFTKTDSARILIHQTRSIQQTNPNRIKFGPRQIPEHNRPKFIQPHGVRDGIAGGFGRLNPLHACSEKAVAVVQT